MLINGSCFVIRAAILGAAVMFSTQSSATTFSLVGDAGSVSLPSNYNPNQGLSRSRLQSMTGTDRVTTYQASKSGGNVGGGLHLSDEGRVRMSFLGKEAAAVNYASFSSVELFSNLVDSGTQSSMDVGAGLVDFSFRTTGLPGIGGASITNGGESEYKHLKIAFSSIFNNGRSVFAFFGDGRRDADYDDLVMRIDALPPTIDGSLPPETAAPVPLPPAIAMILAGIGMLAGVRFRRRAADTA